MNRRALLAATAAMAMPGATAALAGEPAKPAIRDEDPKHLKALRGYLAKAEIVVGNGVKTQPYLVFNDNPPDYRFNPGRFLEALLANAMDVFDRAGLAPRTPERRLSVVILEQEPFDRLATLDDYGGSSGVYKTDLRTAIIRLKHEADDTSEPIDWDGTLMNFGHEAIHQITYTSGMLDPTWGPDCIGEGLATLGEVSSWITPHLLKQTNLNRLERLRKVGQRGVFPLEEFFRKDDYFSGKDISSERSCDAYAWAWLLVYLLMTEEDLRPKFRAYLRAIATRDDKTHRVEDARKHLGNLDELQARMVRRMRHLIARPPSRYTSVRRAATEVTTIVTNQGAR